MTLLRYRFRPIPSAPFGLLAVGWLVAAGLVVSTFEPGTGLQAETETLFLSMRVGALVLGLGGAFLVSVEIDPPEELLRAAPLPFWRTPALRLLTWFLGGNVTLGTFVFMVDERVQTPTSVLLAGSLPEFLLVVSLCFLAASLAGTYVGGGAGLGMLGAFLLAENAWSRFPLRLRDLPESPTWAASRIWAAQISGVLLVIALRQIHSSGHDRSSRRFFMRARGTRKLH